MATAERLSSALVDRYRIERDLGASQWVDDGIVVIQNLHVLDFCHKL